MTLKYTGVGYFSDSAAVSDAQAVLILLFIVLMLALIVKITVGDNLVAAADWISRFRVWGTVNAVMAPSGGKTMITITSPANGDTRYSDENLQIAGRLVPGQGRRVMIVCYRVNGGEWTKAQISGDRWTGETRQYSTGSYAIEAVAYDDAGTESDHVTSGFTVRPRLYVGASYVADDIPRTMITGDLYLCHITFRNTGNIFWMFLNYELKPYDGTCGATTIPISSVVVPQAVNTFQARLTAPDAPGDYTLTYRMSSKEYGWFGEEMSKKITVTPGYLDAKIVSTDIPSEMTDGDTYQAKITLRNTGTCTWYASEGNRVVLGLPDGNSGDAYRFGVKGSQAMSSWSEVKANGEYTFQFPITAPAQGDYTLRFRPLARDTQWFGEQAEKKVHVKAKAVPTARPTENPGPDDDPYEAYLASGNFKIIDKDGSELTNRMCEWCYDGPLVRHNQRSSYVKKDGYADWDIGGPNGHYHIYIAITITAVHPLI